MSSSAGTVEVFGKLIEYAEKFGLIDRLLSFFSSPCTCVVLGSSGVGKTSFVKSVQEQAADFISSVDRTLMNEKYKLKIAGELFRFIDTPGHISYSVQRNDAYRDAIRADRLVIINVVAFGFHETDTYTVEPVSHGTVNSDYLKRGRELEINALSEWAGLIDSLKTKVPIITVVSKADLWWSMAQTVRSYYMSGDYAKRLSDTRMPHAVQSYCAHIKKFYNQGEVDGSFDDGDRRVLRSSLLENIVVAAASE